MSKTQAAPPPCHSEDDSHAGIGEGATQALSGLARLGLVGRTVFYLVLVYLTARIAALGGPSAHPADTQGALAIVSQATGGKVAIALAAAGFFVFGVARIYSAARDRSVGPVRRTMAGLQGAFYVVLTYVPISFLAGNYATGSQRQTQATTARLMVLPAGRAVVIFVGVVVMGVCVNQVRNALSQDFAEGMADEGSPRWVRALVRYSGSVGIASRAAVFFPIGIFFVVAAVQFDPAHAQGLDVILLSMAASQWGRLALVLVAAGLFAFTLYSGLEARYRRVLSAK